MPLTLHMSPERRAFLAQFSLPAVLGLSAVLFSLSTALHFVQRGSLSEFLLGIITIIPVSAIFRFATKDIVLRLQSEDYEFIGGVVSGILGYARNCQKEGGF
jgi:hypothetical protein